MAPEVQALSVDDLELLFQIGDLVDKIVLFKCACSSFYERMVFKILQVFLWA